MYITIIIINVQFHKIIEHLIISPSIIPMYETEVNGKLQA